MYNLYDEDGDKVKREMLTILNWRHAFQTALVWLLDYADVKPFNKKHSKPFVVTNDIIHEMGKDYFEYLNSTEYMQSMTVEGIYEYVDKYYPEKIYLCKSGS